MSDTGLAVVTAPVPNENQQQQSHQDKVSIITDNMSIAHKVAITKPTTLPLSPALAQSTNQSNHESLSQNITAPKEPVTPIKSTPIPMSDSQSPQTLRSNLILEKEVDNELKSDPSLQTSEKFEKVSSGGGGEDSQIKNLDAEGEANAVQNDDELSTKKPAKLEETIIDGFSICAFNSWEDLQDELNERIAADSARGRAVEKERQDSEKVIKKRKHRSRPKIPHAVDDSNSCSQSTPKEDKSKKSKKTGEGAKNKKSSNGHPSTSGNVEEQGKKHKSSNREEDSNPVGNASRTERSIDGETSQTPKKVKREDDMRHDGNNNDNQQNNSSRSNAGRPSDQNTLQSPQVHSRSETQSRTSTSMLASDLLKDPTQPISCSPFRNSHLNRMYDVTSSIKQPMQTALPHTGAQMNQTKMQQQYQQQTQQHSQSQSHIRHGLPAQQLPSNYPPKPPLIQGLPHYQSHTQAPIYPPPNYNFPTANQSQSFYHHSLHNLPPPPPNHYLYHPPSTSIHPTNSHSQIPSHLNIRSQSNHSQNSQAQQHYHHQQRASTAHHPPPQPPPPPPFGMYPSHMGHPQQTQESSMVASMSMSSLPTPYGSPYIVTDTTISRQTSIIPPPPPTALEQAAASSAAIRFGHHPNMLHSMSAYNPANAAAAAAAAAAASVAAQSHHQNPTSLYQSPFPSERSFMDLARSCAESGGHLANYHSMMQSSYPTPTSSSATANPYSLDRWPKVAYEQHQRAVSRYNSFYPNGGMPMLPDRTGFGSSSLRPPPFPAGLFPPPF